MVHVHQVSLIFLIQLIDTSLHFIVSLSCMFIRFSFFDLHGRYIRYNMWRVRGCLLLLCGARTDTNSAWFHANILIPIHTFTLRPRFQHHFYTHLPNHSS